MWLIKSARFLFLFFWKPYYWIIHWCGLILRSIRTLWLNIILDWLQIQVNTKSRSHSQIRYQKLYQSDLRTLFNTILCLNEFIFLRKCVSRYRIYCHQYSLVNRCFGFKKRMKTTHSNNVILYTNANTNTHTRTHNISENPISQKQNWMHLRSNNKVFASDKCIESVDSHPHIRLFYQVSTAQRAVNSITKQTKEWEGKGKQ